LLCCEHDSALLEGGVQPVSQSPAPLGFVVGACWQWNPYGDEVDELKGANSPVACIRASPQNNSCRRQLGCDKKEPPAHAGGSVPVDRHSVDGALAGRLAFGCSKLKRDAALVRLHRNFSLALRLVNGTDDRHRAHRGLRFDD
jgi:hypothetical protein